jgi:hypothetical protein
MFISSLAVFLSGSALGLLCIAGVAAFAVLAATPESPCVSAFAVAIPGVVDYIVMVIVADAACGNRQRFYN